MNLAEEPVIMMCFQLKLSKTEICSLDMAKRQMLVRLIHNPGAGVGKVHYKDDVAEMIEAAGYACEYSTSKKKALKKISPNTSLIAIAGGDGTIRQTILTLLSKKLKHKRPIALLPLGTANNIAGTFGIEKNMEKNISSWSNAETRQLDVGQVTGLGETVYFLESFGFGLFPKLMKSLSRKETKPNNPQDEFKMALEALSTLASTYKGMRVELEIEGQVTLKECILLEVMNISTFGPKLNLCEDALPGDGFFDVVIVENTQREHLKTYISQVLEGKEAKFPIAAIRTKKLLVKTNGVDLHADDQLIKAYQQERLAFSSLSGLIDIIS